MFHFRRKNKSKLQYEYRVTRLDRLVAYVDALIEIHPEIKNHLEVVDFQNRYEDYKAEMVPEIEKQLIGKEV